MQLERAINLDLSFLHIHNKIYYDYDQIQIQIEIDMISDYTKRLIDRIFYVNSGAPIELHINSMSKNEKNKNAPQEQLEMCVFEAIRDHGLIKGKLHYLIKWKDFPQSENTWQPIEHLKEIEDQIKVFERIKARKGKQKIMEVSLGGGGMEQNYSESQEEDNLLNAYQPSKEKSKQKPKPKPKSRSKPKKKSTSAGKCKKQDPKFTKEISKEKSKEKQQGKSKSKEKYKPATLKQKEISRSQREIREKSKESEKKSSIKKPKLIPEAASIVNHIFQQNEDRSQNSLSEERQEMEQWQQQEENERFEEERDEEIKENEQKEMGERVQIPAVVPLKHENQFIAPRRSSRKRKIIKKQDFEEKLLEISKRRPRLNKPGKKSKKQMNNKEVKQKIVSDDQFKCSQLILPQNSKEFNTRKLHANSASKLGKYLEESDDEIKENPAAQPMKDQAQPESQDEIKLQYASSIQQQSSQYNQQFYMSNISYKLSKCAEKVNLEQVQLNYSRMDKLTICNANGSGSGSGSGCNQKKDDEDERGPKHDEPLQVNDENFQLKYTLPNKPPPNPNLNPYVSKQPKNKPTECKTVQSILRNTIGLYSLDQGYRPNILEVLNFCRIDGHVIFECKIEVEDEKGLQRGTFINRYLSRNAMRRHYPLKLIDFYEKHIIEVGKKLV